MNFLRSLSEDDVERLLRGHVPAEGDARLEEVAVFVRALGAAVPDTTRDPDPALITQLAGAAAASADATVSALPNPQTTRGRSRAGLVARIGFAAATVPVLFAGLAVAGVSVPGPAQDAFERVGIELPNQPSDDPVDGAADPIESDGNGNGSEDSGRGPDDSPAGAGKARPRTQRTANGPSRSVVPNPPGNAVRRGPNRSPQTPRGKPEGSPGGGSSGGSGGSGKALGQSDGKGNNG